MILDLEFDGRRAQYRWRQCPACSAPTVSPMPATWTVDLIKEGLADGPVELFYTPHRDRCRAQVVKPEPGHAVRVPGSVIQLGSDEPARTMHLFNPFMAGSPSGEVRSDWCGYGVFTHMMTGRGFCGRGEDHQVHTRMWLFREGSLDPVPMLLPDGSRTFDVPIALTAVPVGLPAGEPVECTVRSVSGDRHDVIATLRLADLDSFTLNPPRDLT